MRLKREALILLVIGGVIAVSPTSSFASRAPNARERSAITHTLRASTETRMVRCFHVRSIVISTAGPWARATLVPCNPQRFDAALAVLHRIGDNWRLSDLGTSGIGCTVAPARVRRDLKLLCS